MVIPGPVAQVLDYRAPLLTTPQVLSGHADIMRNAFEPWGVVIVGNSAKSVGSAKKRSFGLYWERLDGVKLITL